MSTAIIEHPAPASLRPRTPFPGMSFDGARLWRHGDDTGGTKGRRETAGDPSVPGDLWIVATELPGMEDFGAADVALVLIHEVDEGRGTVVASPVTALSEPAPATNQVLIDGLLGCPVVLWPEITATLPAEALTRRIGSAIDALTLAKIRNGLTPLPTVGDLADEGSTPEGLAEQDTYLTVLMAALAVPANADDQA